MWPALVAIALLSAPDEEELFRPTTSGPFLTFTAPITREGHLLVQPIFSSTSTRGAFDGDGRFQPAATSDTIGGIAIFTEYGISETFAAGGQLNTLAAQTLGLGDLQLFGRAVVLRERARLVPEVTVLAQVKLPTGRAPVFGTGSTDLTLGLDFTKGVRPLLLHADLLFTHAFPGDVLLWSISAEWPFRLPFGAMVELSGRHQRGPASMELVAGAGVEVIFHDRVQLLAGWQRALAGVNVPAADAVIVTLTPLF